MTLFWILLGLLGLTAALICYSAYVVSSRENYVPRDYYEKVVSEMAKRNVDAADIVRCSECKHWVGNISEDDGIYEDECKWITEEAPNADDFCSYGERSDNE